MEYLPIDVAKESITFKKDPKYKEGDVIVAGIIEKAPDGFMRKVIDVRKGKDSFVYETESAVLTDVFEEAHIVRSFAVTEKGVYSIGNPDDGNMTINRAMGNAKTNFSGYNAIFMKNGEKSTNSSRLVQLTNTDRELLFRGEFEKELNDLISVRGEVGFDVWFEIKIDIEDGNIEFGVATHTKTEGEFFIGCKGEAFEKDKDEGKYSKVIFEKNLPNFQFSIGYVPVVITNDFEVRVEASAQIEGAIGVTVEVGAERVSGFEYNSKNGEITEINEREYLGDGLKWDVTAKTSGEVSAGIYAHLITKLYGSTGADLAVGIMGNIEG